MLLSHNFFCDLDLGKLWQDPALSGVGLVEHCLYYYLLGKNIGKMSWFVNTNALNFFEIMRNIKITLFFKTLSNFKLLSK